MNHWISFDYYKFNPASQDLDFCLIFGSIARFITRGNYINVFNVYLRRTTQARPRSSLQELPIWNDILQSEEHIKLLNISFKITYYLIGSALPVGTFDWKVQFINGWKSKWKLPFDIHVINCLFIIAFTFWKKILACSSHITLIAVWETPLVKHATVDSEYPIISPIE